MYSIFYLIIYTITNFVLFFGHCLRTAFLNKKTRYSYTKFYLFTVQCFSWPLPHQKGFQVPASPVMEGIIDFHHDLMFFLLIILGFVIFFLSGIASYFINVKPVKKNTNAGISLNNHQMILEIIWTLLPALILLSIVLPSFALIYSMDEFFLNPKLTIKAIGNQWYWSYNYGGSLVNKEVDSRMDLRVASYQPLNTRAYLTSLTDFYSNASRVEDILNFFVKLNLICFNQRQLYKEMWLLEAFEQKLDYLFANSIYYSFYLDLRGTLLSTLCFLDLFVQEEVPSFYFNHLIAQRVEPLVDLLFAENYRLALIDMFDEYRTNTKVTFIFHKTLLSLNKVLYDANNFPHLYVKTFSDIPFMDSLLIKLFDNIYVSNLFNDNSAVLKASHFNMRSLPVYELQYPDYNFAKRLHAISLFCQLFTEAKKFSIENSIDTILYPDEYAGQDGRHADAHIGRVQLKFDSYMLPDELVPLNGLRLLEVDKRLILPSKTGIRLLVSSYDVLHSWAVPALGIKLDGCPGRLNQTFLFIKNEGTYYGQCSEICGVNHGFMPIVIRAVSLKNFTFWLSRHIEANQAVIEALALRRLDY